MNEMESAKTSWSLVLVFAASIFLGIMIHFTGYQVNPVVPYFSIGLFVFTASLFIYTSYLWFRAFKKHDYFQKERLFILYSIVILLFTIIFLLDPIFTVKTTTSGTSIIVDTVWWPFLLIEIPLMIVFIVVVDRTIIWPNVDKHLLALIYERRGCLYFYQYPRLNRAFFDNYLLLLKGFAKKEKLAYPVRIVSMFSNGELRTKLVSENHEIAFDLEAYKTNAPIDEKVFINDNEIIANGVNLSKIAARLSKKKISR
jgi:hypothetical protein